MDGLQNLREELENFDFDVKDERMLYKCKSFETTFPILVVSLFLY